MKHPEAESKTPVRMKSRIPAWHHGCALFLFSFVAIFLNMFTVMLPIVGALIGFFYFFYWKRGTSPEKFDPITFVRHFKVSDIGPFLRGIVFGAFMAAGIFAPFRAIVLGLLSISGLTGVDWIRALLVEDWGQKPGLYPEGLFGFCGILLGMIAGFSVWARGLRLRSQLRNLPTSTVGSVAIGLSELKGVAQPRQGEAKDRKEETEKGEQRIGKTSPILLNNLYVYENEVKGKTICSRFYLDDGTGRILVDPRGIKFWDGRGNFLWQPFRIIYLAKRISEEVMPWRYRATLLPGDPVYVIGNVEENKEAPLDAADSERLVIRPRSGGEEPNLMKRILFGEKRKTTGKDIYNVFFLTDVTEADATALFTRGLKTVWIWMLVWVALSLTLAVAYGTVNL